MEPPWEAALDLSAFVITQSLSAGRNSASANGGSELCLHVSPHLFFARLAQAQHARCLRLLKNLTPHARCKSDSFMNSRKTLRNVRRLQYKNSSKSRSVVRMHCGSPNS